jgi:hypothetical protein
VSLPEECRSAMFTQLSTSGQALQHQGHAHMLHSASGRGVLSAGCLGRRMPFQQCSLSFCLTLWARIAPKCTQARTKLITQCRRDAAVQGLLQLTCAFDRYTNATMATEQPSLMSCEE